jgi:hypothetical protein
MKAFKFIALCVAFVVIGIMREKLWNMDYGWLVFLGLGVVYFVATYR